MEPTTALLDQLKAFRHLLHQHPELSGQEVATARRLHDFVAQYQPDQVLEGLGGNGLAAVYQGCEAGPTLLFRGDIDALPIQELGAMDYRSGDRHVSHLCGHDGHMTIITGLAALLHQRPIQRGRVVLLFQPAEETGQGAAWILADPRFQALRPDFVFGLHNLPQYPLGKVLVKTGVFTAASKGMIVTLKGATSHAAHPENGRSPALAMAQIVTELTHLPQAKDFEDFVLTTVVHAHLGEVAFGTAPGEAKVMATLRSYQDADMDQLTAYATDLVHRAATAAGLEWDVAWTDVFPATVNHDGAIALLQQAIQDCGYEMQVMSQPFRWSEDFGHYLRHFPGAFFGLGAGETHPQLHNADYDFPDELIGYGVRLFSRIAYNCLGVQSSPGSSKDPE